MGISAEEFREAMLKDQQDMNFENPQPEDMEISFTKGRLKSNRLILPYFAKYISVFSFLARRFLTHELPPHLTDTNNAIHGIKRRIFSVENMMPAQLQNQPSALPIDPIPQQKRRGLQALSEKEEEDPQEMGADGSKKMRFFSPAKPVVAARFPQTQAKIIRKRDIVNIPFEENFFIDIIYWI